MVEKQLTFQEREALKVSAVDRDLYKRIKNKLEENPVSGVGSKELIWEPAYEAFLVENT